jgi:hypothetical protein
MSNNVISGINLNVITKKLVSNRYLLTNILPILSENSRLKIPLVTLFTYNVFNFQITEHNQSKNHRHYYYYICIQKYLLQVIKMNY